MHPSQVEFFRHILHECHYIQKEYEENSFDEFMQNERLSKALCRSLEMRDIRNKNIHHYFGVDYDIVWNTIKTDIPVLEEYITSIINSNK